MIVLIDNYDSFVHNLARYFTRLGQETCVVRHDQTSAEEVRRMAPAAVVISPGPGRPTEAGCSIELVRQLGADVPMLGVCLGHQAIAAALGGEVVRSAQPYHGRTSMVEHDGRGLFEGLPSPLTACRYHSLCVVRDSLPEELLATASTSDGTIMALSHRQWPVYGVQFHPEAILTGHGYQLLSNFLRLAGLPVTRCAEQLAADELREQRPPEICLPPLTLTF